MGLFADGTRDAIRDAAFSYVAGLVTGPETAPINSNPMVAKLPEPSAQPIETGSIGKSTEPAPRRQVRKRPVKQESNPVLRFGMRLGEAVDEFFGYRRKQ